MKKVHDIINVQMPGKNPDGSTRGFPVAFIQSGRLEDMFGIHYEYVCVYCAKSIGESDPKGDMRFMVQEGARAMALHYEKGCPSFGAFKWQVERARTPLDTLDPPRIM